MKKDQLMDLFNQFEEDALNVNQLRTIKGGHSHTGTSGCATEETDSGTPAKSDDCDCDDDDFPSDTTQVPPPRIPA